jgi:hypothetical protein
MIRNVPLPVMALIASLLCPTELSVYIAGLRLPPHRIALLILLPLAVHRLITRTDIRLHGFDYAMIAFNVATFIAFALHGMQFIGPELTPSNGLVYGGSIALESLAGYLVARVWVRDLKQFRAVAQFLVAAALVAGLIAAPDTLFGRHYAHDLLQSLTGYAHPRNIEERLGLTRGYGTFDHPILLGTFCASVLALAWYGTRPGVRRWLRVLAVVAATFTAVSSAPLLICALLGVLIGWDYLTRGVKNRARMAFAVAAVAYVAASLTMNRTPIAFIATGMTLDPWTGFYRLMIWEFGLENVWANPWIGLGLADWERPAWMASPSIDAFWLVIAMRTGIPTFLLLILSIGLMVRGVVRRGCKSKERDVHAFANAWLFSLIALALAACTVHYWNTIYAYFFFFLGLAGWIADPKKSTAKAKAVLPTIVQPPVSGFGMGGSRSSGARQPAMVGRRIEAIR